MSLDDGDTLRLSDKFAFFRGLNTDASSGRRDVPLNDLVTLLNDPLVLTEMASQTALDLKAPLAAPVFTGISDFSAGGAYFGTAAAANLLDDYEEGTWTPALPNGGTLTVNSATYTKVGRMVHAKIFVTSISPTADASGFRLGGLPFTSSADSNSYGSGIIAYCGDGNLSSWGVIVITNDTYIYFHDKSGSAVSLTNNNYIAAASGSVDELILSFAYYV
jgi:hypothetical protein